MRITMIISGGQTGVDRAALDWAIENGVPHGGTCPKGRIAEDGRIPDRYRMTEHTSPKYPPRTEANIKTSDATVIIFYDHLGKGSLLTKKLAEKHRKPLCVLRATDSQCLESFKAFLLRFQPKILNVAGPRASNWPDSAAQTKRLLEVLKFD